MICMLGANSPQSRGRKPALRREIPSILSGFPRASKLLICGLFQKGRVLAQDGMKQVARNLTDMWDGFLLGKRYLIHDRDPLFTEAVRGLLRDSGVKPLRLPAQ